MVNIQLNRGYNVDAFEINMIYLYDGHVQYPIVKEYGIMYLEYLMWLDDDNTDNLNSNQYLKQCEMQNYFKEG